MSTSEETPLPKQEETTQQEEVTTAPPPPQDSTEEEDQKRSRVEAEVPLLTDAAPEAKKLKLDNDGAAAAAAAPPAAAAGVAAEPPTAPAPVAAEPPTAPAPVATEQPTTVTDVTDVPLQLHPEKPDGVPIPAAKEGISFFGDNDVLSGRGGGTNVHPGNRNFRDLINLHRRAYLKARKNDKPAISRAIVRAIRDNNGKFLKKDEKSGLWFEIGDDAAREKTSQALRQRAPEMRKLLFDTEREEARAAAEEQMRQQRMLIGMNPQQQPHPGAPGGGGGEVVGAPNGMPMPPPGGPMPPGAMAAMPAMPGAPGAPMFPNPALFAMANGGKNGVMPNMPPGQEGYAQMFSAALLGGGMNRYTSNGA